MTMLQKILKKLEDPKFPLLGPNIKLLKFWGLLIPKSKLMKILSYFAYTLIFIFIVTAYADVWFVRSDINFLLNNLKTSLMSTVNIFKVTMFWFWHKRWRTIIDYVTEADRYQRIKKDTVSDNIIKTNTKYCRKVSYIYCSLTYLTAFLISIQPILKYAFSETYRYNVKNGIENYIDAVRTWTPLDKTKISEYVVAIIYQICATFVVAGYISSLDSFVIVVMVFFKTELILLREDCKLIFGAPFMPIDNENARNNIMDCHRRHVLLVKYAQLFNSCLSPVIFLYLVVCSIMLCASVFQVTIGTNKVQQLLTAEYVVFALAQLFMYCWHSNEVYFASQYLSLGPYESTWWNRNKQCQKDICILIHQFNRPIIFSAWPFPDLNVSTFISVIKGAYSYYTLIN